MRPIEYFEATALPFPNPTQLFFNLWNTKETGSLWPKKYSHSWLHAWTCWKYPNDLKIWSIYIFSLFRHPVVCVGSKYIGFAFLASEKKKKERFNVCLPFHQGSESSFHLFACVSKRCHQAAAIPPFPNTEEEAGREKNFRKSRLNGKEKKWGEMTFNSQKDMFLFLSQRL